MEITDNYGNEYANVEELSEQVFSKYFSGEGAIEKVDRRCSKLIVLVSRLVDRLIDRNLLNENELREIFQDLEFVE